MKAHVIIEKGQARLVRPVYLKPDAPTCFEVEIPDDAVLDSRDWSPEKLPDSTPSGGKPAGQPGSLQAELNDILGDLARVRPGTSIGDDHQILLEAMEDRYAGR
ncbi:hypothetical protein [Desulfosoma sp.]